MDNCGEELVGNGNAADRCGKDLLELAQRLNQERQFVTSERLHLQQLNEKVQKTVERLFHATWIARQQRVNLDSLVLSKGYSDSTPSACCQRASLLEGVRFVDGYKQLGFHESQYGEFVQSLRDNPRMLAMCLAAGEARLGAADPTLNHVVHVVVDSVYGHCVLEEDERLVLQLLRHLMEMQLASNDNPLRLLRHGTCAFGRVYKLFNEGLFSAKLFLTGALHDPIMHLLMEDELFLDIDPSKAVVRFPPHERRRRFGDEGTPQYAASLQRYRNWTINKLVHLTERFVVGIRENMYCFPDSLLWLIRQLYNALMRAKRVEVREVGAMCADLVFAAFICPAIVNPEPYGVCDAPISYIARFNLMQVAQILQVLAMSKWEEIDPKLMDLYGRFEKDCMSSLLDRLLEGGVDDIPKMGAPPMEGLVRTAVLITGSNLQSLVYFLRVILNDSTEKWLDKQVLQSVLNLLPSTSSCRGQTRATDANGAVGGSTPQTPGPRKSILGKVGRNRQRGGGGGSGGSSPSGSTIAGGAGLASCGNDHPFHHHHHHHHHQQHQHHHHHHQHHRGNGAGVGRQSPSVQRRLTQNVGGDDNIGCNGGNSCGGPSGSMMTTNSVEIEDVLVISLSVNIECPGMLPEHKVLSIEQQQQQQQQKQVRMNLDVEEDDGGGGDDDDHDDVDDEEEEDRSSAGGGAGRSRNNGNGGGGGGGEKRTRFSLSHDQDSIGNASDNLEAVSEAASNHSVSSSIELENENDNLSDMISANVSGRGTPNVSGRGTPSSQVEGDERDRRPLDLPVTAEKQNREDISDKFGKFDIKTLMAGDETVSIISDTWSTDVLASDSETVEQGERHLEYGHHLGAVSISSGGAAVAAAASASPLASSSNAVARAAAAAAAISLISASNAPSNGQQQQQQQLQFQLQQASIAVSAAASMLDTTETASEAWSTDVAASDSERLQDVDTDDTASVTRSDDTASIARSDDAAASTLSAADPLRCDVTDHGGGGGDENVTPRASGGRSPIDGLGSSGTWMNVPLAVGLQLSDTGSTAVQEDHSPPALESSELVVLSHGLEGLEMRRRRSVDTDSTRGPIALAKIVDASSFDPLIQLNTSDETMELEMCDQRDRAFSVLSDDAASAVSDVMGMQSLGRLSFAMDDLQLLPQTSNGEIEMEMEIGDDVECLHPSDVDVFVKTDNGGCREGSIGAAEAWCEEADDDGDDGRYVQENRSASLSKVIAPENNDDDGGGGGVAISARQLSYSSITSGSSSSLGAGGGGGGGGGGGSSANSSGSGSSGLGSASGDVSAAVVNLADCNSVPSSSLPSQPWAASSVKSRIRSISASGVPESEIACTTLATNLIPTASSGAIPKSISFDKTAERGDKEANRAGDASGSNEDLSKSSKKSFFRNFKLTLKRPARKGAAAAAASSNAAASGGGGGGEVDYKDKNGSTLSNSSVAALSNKVIQRQETGEDILAKYRSKRQQLSMTDDGGGGGGGSSLPTDALAGSNSSSGNHMDVEYRGGCGGGGGRRGSSGARSSLNCQAPSMVSEAMINSDDHLEDSYAFNDAKRKLRLVLSTAETQATPWGSASFIGGSPAVAAATSAGIDRHHLHNQHRNLHHHYHYHHHRGGSNELADFLKIQLAEAINLQDRSLTAQLHEALRCVGVFDKSGKLLKSLTEDYRRRHLYVAYLIRCRQSLLSSLSHAERLLRRVERDKEVCDICMISVCVRLFLERHERRIQSFLDEFQKLTASDEKTDMVEEFLQSLYKQAENDLMWQDASSGQLDRAQCAIERSIMSKIYILSLYPNGDGDVHRDQVLHEHIKKLSKVITPNHKDLRIPKIYHYECPWPSAQAEVITINAYKTPGDKLQCVVRCCTTIMNLLRMANDKSVPAADDFIPVLVYVVIKANPASLLSTVQYVNSFYQKQLRGEDEYWWTQFSSAVEFIKTMDYAE